MPANDRYDVTLADLQPAGTDVLHPEARLDGLEIRGDASGGDATGARLVECRLVDVVADDARWASLRLVGCQVDGLRASEVGLSACVWREVAIEGGRVGALVAPGARLTRVRLRGVRVDYLNLRGAELVDVRLEDCEVGGLDLLGARVTRLDLPGSRVGAVTVREAALRDVDLSEGRLGPVDGVRNLSGATVSHGQLLDLAPALADSLGIRLA